MIKCRINITKCEIDKNINVYGIDFMKNGQLLYQVKDISSDFRKIKHLCEIIDRSDISQNHIADIIEDFIG